MKVYTVIPGIHEIIVIRNGKKRNVSYDYDEMISLLVRDKILFELGLITAKKLLIKEVFFKKIFVKQEEVRYTSSTTEKETSRENMNE